MDNNYDGQCVGVVGDAYGRVEDAHGRSGRRRGSEKLGILDGMADGGRGGRCEWAEGVQWAQGSQIRAQAQAEESRAFVLGHFGGRFGSVVAVVLHGVGWGAPVVVVAPDAVPHGGDEHKPDEHNRCIVDSFLVDGDHGRHTEQRNGEATPRYRGGNRD